MFKLTILCLDDENYLLHKAIFDKISNDQIFETECHDPDKAADQLWLSLDGTEHRMHEVKRTLVLIENLKYNKPTETNNNPKLRA